MPEIIFLHKTITESGLIYAGQCVYGGYQPELDGANNQEITIYDNTAGEGNPIKPKATLDAAEEGEQGVRGQSVAAQNGLWGEISGSGTRKVTVYYLPAGMCPVIVPSGI